MNVFASEEIGARIAQARDEAGLSQDELSDLLGLSMRQVQNLEYGESKPYKHLKQIAEITGRPFEWFLHGDAEATDDEDRLRQIVREELAVVLEALEPVLRRLEERGQEPPRQAESPEAPR